MAVRNKIFNTPRSLEAMILPPGARLTSFEDQRRVYENTIVYTSWERTTVSRELIEILNRVAQVWVPCVRNFDAFERSGMDPKKLAVIPCPYDPPTHLPSQIPAPRGSETVPDGKRFYSIGKWEPRKAYHGLIGAFLQAYSPSDRASLYIKTSPWSTWDGYPTPTASLRHWMERMTDRWTPALIEQRVRVTTSRLGADALNDVHRQNNIYVSASHGEAWDLPAFDAMAAGNTLVHVGYGGTEEYAMGLNVVPWFYGPVHPDYGWEPEAEWAEYTEEHLVQALRRATAPTRRLHPPWFSRQYSHEAVGKRMLHAIMKLPENNGAIWERLRAVGCFG
jgi:glycosyltransferase involved in cell wall biosynthesis